MRRKDREITKIEELLHIIEECKVCRIAMKDKDNIYMVPMNFGYTYVKNQLVLYFHCAKEGKKIDVLREHTNVGFEMDCEHKLITAEEACEYAYSFASIIGNGQAEFVENMDEKIEGLKELMKHQAGKVFEFNSKMAESVCVFKIVATSFTGKRHE